MINAIPQNGKPKSSFNKWCFDGYFRLPRLGGMHTASETRAHIDLLDPLVIPSRVSQALLYFHFTPSPCISQERTVAEILWDIVCNLLIYKASWDIARIEQVSP